jgi:signal recognition particle subunit SRP54
MRAVTGVPIKFVGVGEKTDALEVFHPDRVAQRILGMGDLLSLIEKAEESFDMKEAERLQKRMMQAEMNFDDLLAQMRQVRKLGPIGQLLDMIPGLNRFKDQINQEDAEKSLRKIEALICSMTTKERRNPKLLNASRKKRIARGAGYVNTDTKPERELEGIQEVNQLLKQLREMQRMMKMLKSGHGPDLGKMFR